MDTRDLVLEFYQARNPSLGNENSNTIYRPDPVQLRKKIQTPEQSYFKKSF